MTYLEILRAVLETGYDAPSAREEMMTSKRIFGKMQFTHDFREGFPLETTKFVSLKNVYHELSWFLQGDQNIYTLVQDGCNIWNQDAYRFYLQKAEFFKLPVMSFQDFIARIKDKKVDIGLKSYYLGDIGDLYPKTWVDSGQFEIFLERIKKEPFRRDHVMSSYDINSREFSRALMPCHFSWQINITPAFSTYKVDLCMFQRSADLFLGLPYNIASYSLLLLLICKYLGDEYVPGELIINIGAADIYHSHIDAVKEQLKRKPYPFPEIILEGRFNNLKEMQNISYSDIQYLTDYKHHPAIKAPLETGLKI